MEQRGFARVWRGLRATVESAYKSGVCGVNKGARGHAAELDGSGWLSRLHKGEDGWPLVQTKEQKEGRERNKEERKSKQTEWRTQDPNGGALVYRSSCAVCDLACCLLDVAAGKIRWVTMASVLVWLLVAGC